MQLEALKALLGAAWADADIIVVVSARVEELDGGLRNVSVQRIQQHSGGEKGGISKTDGATLLMMAGELLEDEPI